MKDYSNVRYFKFSAEDPWEIKFTDIVIDLVTDCMISGIISSGRENDDKWSVDVEKNLNELPNPNYSIFAKVVDTGVYWLLDENMQPVYKSEGYVPSLMDYYNKNKGFGDYIELLVDDISTGRLAHSTDYKTKFNRDTDWENVEATEPNLYSKGMNDAFSIILNILTSDDKSKVENAINTINNFKNKSNS